MPNGLNEHVGNQTPRKWEYYPIMKRILILSLFLLTSHSTRAAYIAKVRLWPNGKVCYDIGTSMDDDEDIEIEKALKHISEMAPITFSRSTCDGKHIFFRKKSQRNDKVLADSDVGFKNRIQDIVFYGDNINRYTILHEVSHALGLLHEFERPDRPNSKISNNKVENVDSVTDDEADGNPHGIYDKHSITHYFESGRSPRLVRLSPGDIVALTSMYGTDEEIEKANRLYIPLIPSGLYPKEFFNLINLLE